MLVNISRHFADPEGGRLIYKSTLSNGKSLPGWIALIGDTLVIDPPWYRAGSRVSVIVTAIDDGGLETNSNAFDIIVDGNWFMRLFWRVF